ncbi:ribonuclease Y [Candidatus Gottesmanbacteria bacterium]|nr:ribonuclease Y [Candidatus Gottesmanbacteria bacterium]
MFDVLKTLSGLVTPRKVVRRVVPAVKKPTPPKPQMTQQAPHPDLSLAQAQVREIIVEAKDEALRIRRNAEEEIRRLEGRGAQLTSQEAELVKKRDEIDKLQKEQIAKLERVANLTRDEAREQILSILKDQLREEMAREIREAADRAREESGEKAREILVDAMRHGATDYVAEFTVSIIKVTDEEIKGRIIGKEGRNIRAFETATGVDVDLDEEGVIRLSCFDPVRREIARVSLERLLRDGRVQPGRIEEVVEQVKKEIERIMFEEGQKLCHEVGVYNLPAPIVALLGRFKYRFSYGQNMIAHTLEETRIGIALAQEVGADVNIVRLGCLLHDIGKVVTDGEGSHVDLGIGVLKKYSIPAAVIDCVAQHHEDIPFSSIEAVLVYIADAISGSRPGARYENYEEYVKRLKDLEAIAKGYAGVRESFAFQAGRELRVVVDPGRVDDSAATIMASQLKSDIEKKLTYPGQIKITVIRELRATEVAK